MMWTVARLDTGKWFVVNRRGGVVPHQRCELYRVEADSREHARRKAQGARYRRRARDRDRFEALVRASCDSFGSMAQHCQHRDGADCTEPSIDFSRMACAPCNCPLLLECADRITNEG